MQGPILDTAADLRKADATATPGHYVGHGRHRHFVPDTTTSTRHGHYVGHGRHRHFVPDAVSPHHHRHHADTVGTAPPAPTAGGNNGTCQSVRIHGQWVERCHLPQ